jgi:hypothetical protein
MIRQTHPPATDPDLICPGLAHHQAEMIRRCPYLGPSVRRGLTLWSGVEAEPGDESLVFAMLTVIAEQVRHARRTDGPLVCRNVALVRPRDLPAAKKLMEMPVWVARNLYAPVQIIVDRFWVGIGRRPGRGRSVMPPVPISYFMIRCGIANRDRVIVSPRPEVELAALRAGPGDDGRDVLTSHLGRRVDNPATAWPELLSAFPVPHRT